MSYITEDDMVFNYDDEKEIQVGGFKIDSVLLKMGMSPIVTMNKDTSAKKMSGGVSNVSELFENLVVPNWVAYFPVKKGGDNHQDRMDDENEENNKEREYVDEDVDDDYLSDNEENEDKIIGGALYDKLLDLATVNPSELKKTKKNKTRAKKDKMKHKKTAKNNAMK